MSKSKKYVVRHCQLPSTDCVIELPIGSEVLTAFPDGAFAVPTLVYLCKPQANVTDLRRFLIVEAGAPFEGTLPYHVATYQALGPDGMGRRGTYHVFEDTVKDPA